tara:strand:+ start:820 stop:1617 length:798 start_codon:yes stop_codon:yes gene_type:complete
MSYIFTPRGAFFFVTLSLVFSGLFTSALILFLKPTNQFLTLSLTLILGELLLIIPLIYVIAKGQGSFVKILRFNKINIRMIILSTLLSIGVIIIADEIERLISLIIPPPEWLNQLSHFLSVDDSFALILIFFAVVPLAAICEEVLFRGFLQQILEKHWGDVTRAILIGSLFFAIIHLVPYWVIQIYILALIMGYLSWVTNSIFPSMILHAINNGIAFSFANWRTFFDGWYDWNGHVSPIILTLAMAMAFLAFRQIQQQTAISRAS